MEGGGGIIHEHKCVRVPEQGEQVRVYCTHLHANNTPCNLRSDSFFVPNMHREQKKVKKNVSKTEQSLEQLNTEGVLRSFNIIYL